MSDKFQKEIARLKRIEGQARGIAKMMEEDRYCIDILQQMQAMEAALKATKQKVLSIHAGCCVQDAIESGDTEAQREKFTDLVELFGKVNR
ncbi:metal-sensitive transcriptional regulator [Erythrobacter sp. MTPC3]|uniref:metal-sensitive transcriptional regulator n=1 Tax=Erythrobacter sp. MTPC3 TaxID=3056564 RepID=UPI0036F3EAE7